MTIRDLAIDILRASDAYLDSVAVVRIVRRENGVVVSVRKAVIGYVNKDGEICIESSDVASAHEIKV